MSDSPTALERPVVVLGGYHTPPLQTAGLRRRLATLTSKSQEDFLGVSFVFTFDLEAAARKAVERVERRWPSEDPERTIEVDVVGVSMGGIVGRVAAAPPEEPGDGEENQRKRLHINRLFTIATPHRGAKLAGAIAIDKAARDMAPGSLQLASLNRSMDSAVYEVVPYARTRDGIVGATRASPPGMAPLWRRGPLLLSHFTVSLERAFLIDIARRLRGEWPLAFSGSMPPRD